MASEVRSQALNMIAFNVYGENRQFSFSINKLSAGIRNVFRSAGITLLFHIDSAFKKLLDAINMSANRISSERIYGSR